MANHEATRTGASVKTAPSTGESPDTPTDHEEQAACTQCGSPIFSVNDGGGWEHQSVRHGKPADHAATPLHHPSLHDPSAPHFHAGWNMPGYMPDSEPSTFEDFDTAKRYVIDELESYADAQQTWADDHDCDDVPCPTHRDDCAWQRASAIALVAEEVNLEAGPFEAHAGEYVYWVAACFEPECIEDEDGHEHAWGPLETSTFAGTLHPKCQGDDCNVVNAYDDEEEEEDDDREPEPPTVWQLARLADVADPDTPESPGARWLQQVASYAEELSEYASGTRVVEDAVTDAADSLVSVYTAERWQVFTDLAAWTEDLADFGQPADMTEGAGVALYLIAERLLTALTAENNR